MDATAGSLFLPTLVAFTIHVGLYGAHVILFALSGSILLRRRAPGHWIHLSVITALFGFSTFGLCVVAGQHSMWKVENVRASYHRSIGYPLSVMAKGQSEYDATTLPLRVTYIMSSFLADCYLTYRCYLVWNSKRITIIPAALILLNFFFQIFPIPGSTFNSLDATGPTRNAGRALTWTVIVHLVLTAMIAGRIMWIERKANHILDKEIQSKYSHTIRVILESGLLYPLALLGMLLLNVVYRQDRSSGAELGLLFFTILALTTVCIAPTLIVIRVGLSISAREDIETLKSPRMSSLSRTIVEDELPKEIDIRRASRRLSL